MRAKNKTKNQLHFLAPTLKERLNPKHGLYLLTSAIDWNYFEEALKVLYSDKGRPAHSIRLMTALLIMERTPNAERKPVRQNASSRP